MTRIHSHASVPTRALDALDVTRARRNSGEARVYARPSAKYHVYANKLKDDVYTDSAEEVQRLVRKYPDATVLQWKPTMDGGVYSIVSDYYTRSNPKRRKVRSSGARKARRNCGSCGPGCGCAPCMEKYGTVANPAEREKAWGVGIMPAESGPGYPDVFEVASWNAIPWGSAWGGYIFTEGPFSTKRGAATWANVWRIGNKVRKNPNTAVRRSSTGLRRNHHLRVGDAVRVDLPNHPRRVKGTIAAVPSPSSAGYGTLREVYGVTFATVGIPGAVHQIEASRIHRGAGTPAAWEKRRNGTVGGLVVGAAAMHVAHRAGYMNPAAKAALPWYGDAEQKADAHRQVEDAYKRLKTSTNVAGQFHTGEMSGQLSHAVAAKAWEEAARQLSRLRSGSWGVTEASARKAVRTAEKATASAEAADERYRAARAESDRIHAKFAARSNPRADLLPTRIGDTVTVNGPGEARLRVTKTKRDSYHAAIEGTRSQVWGPTGSRWGNATEMRADIAHWLRTGALPYSGGTVR